MKKSKYGFLCILVLAIPFLFYKADFLVAMAAGQNVAFAVEPAAEPVSGPAGGNDAGPAAGPVDETAAEPAAGPVDETAAEPTDEPAAETADETAVEPAEEIPAAPAAGLEPMDEMKPGQTVNAAVGPGLGQTEEPPAGPEPEQIEKPPVGPEPAEGLAAELNSGESVSTGAALAEWLEAHKNTGGAVKLADHVVLEGTYIFCPDGADRPAVFVDTDSYTITVTGVAEFMSDSHLTFSGQPEGKGIFYVASGGMLSLSNIAVESSRCALWQEEGAGLLEEDCHISGSIHYADTPFVMDMDSPCIIVEKGQSLMEVLPEQIECTVNRQGQLSNHEWVPLSWDLEGTERQQEERRRFQMQGSFLHMLSAEPAQCTVVYNDYPLTFKDVWASVNDGLYLFKGLFTVQEGSLPITVMSEYSFDGENWFLSEEINAKGTNPSFVIFVPAQPRGGEAQINIYIRLHWNDNGTSYFSNVLRYSADNLDYAEDIGGSRGGGTSIVNPPDKPKKGYESEAAAPLSDDTKADAGQAVYAENPNADDGQNAPAGPEAAGGTQTAHEGPKTDGEGQASQAEPKMVNGGQPAYPELKTVNGVQSAYAELKTNHAEQLAETEPQNESNAGKNPDRKEGVNRSAALPQTREQTPDPAIRRSSQIAVAAGFVLLSVIVGIAGFFVHSRSGTNR